MRFSVGDEFDFNDCEYVEISIYQKAALAMHTHTHTNATIEPTVLFSCSVFIVNVMIIC